MAGAIDSMRRHGVIWRLILVNLAVFLLAGFFLLADKAGASINPEAWLALPGSWTAWVAEPWTLLTYMFTHTHPLHLLMNVLWLGWFGSILVPVAGGRRIVWLYLGGGIAGGLLYLFLTPALHSAFSRLLGASAAVLAIMTYAAVSMPGYTFHLFFIGDVKLKWMALFMIALAFLGLGGGNAGGELAHLGGAAFGLCAGLASRHFHLEKKSASGHNRRRSSRVINIMEQHRRDAERLDELLDKIRISGFGSLSRSERKELEELSKRVVK